MASPAARAFPYLATAMIKYKSPHKQDLIFAKGETIRVTGIAPKAEEQGGDQDDDDDDDDDWLVGESLDGSRNGTFPGGFVEPSDEQDEQEVEAAAGVSNLAPATASVQPVGATETETTTEPAKSAPVVPEAAREAALEGKTETAGFGAPLPPRPADSDDEDDAAAEAEQDKEAIASAPAPAPAPTPAPRAAVGQTEQKGAPSAAAASEVIEPAASTANTASASDGAAPVAAKSPTTTTGYVSPPAASKSPPPITTKPASMSSSFRDRLAAFNKPVEAAAPPPVPRGKPGGWKRPAPPADAPKPVLPGQPAAPAPSASAAAKPEPRTRTAAADAPPAGELLRSRDDSGFSAADAQSSIKMSLKQRMAALQRGEAAPDGVTSPPPKPTPAPGRIAADKRNAALAGIGLAPAPPQPARSLSKDSAKSSDNLGGAPTEEAEAGAAATVPADEGDQGAPAASQAPSADAGNAAASEQIEAGADEAGEVPELTEEDQEAGRRAALGGRRMGGGPALFGAPAPVKKASTSSASDQGTSVEPGIVEPRPEATAAPKTSSTSAEPETILMSPISDVSAAEAPTTLQDDNQPKTLAVPRRAAPPRRKRPAAAAPAPTSSATAASPAAEEPTEAEAADEQPISPVSVREESTAEPDQGTGATHGSGLADAAVAAGVVGGADALAAGTSDHAEDTQDEGPAQASSDLAKAQESTSHAGAPAEAEDDGAVPTETLAQHHDSTAPTAATADDDEDEVFTAAATPSGYESEDARIREHERQLEEYLKGRGITNDDDSDEVEVEDDAETVNPLAAEKNEADEATDIVPAEDHSGGALPSSVGLARQPSLSLRQDAATPKPPSRPPSTCPPVPKTSLPLPPPPPIDTDGGHSDATAACSIRSPLSPGRDSTASPAQDLAANRRSFVPPVPRSSFPPPPMRDEDDAVAPPPLPRSPPPPLNPAPPPLSFGSVAADASHQQEAAPSVPAPAPILAAPRPRMAIPTDDPEDEELLQAADAAQQDTQREPEETAAALETQRRPEVEAAAEQEEKEPVELTEEQEAQRRANLANRMARLGGQRIGGLPGMAPPPIMGGPMPPRRSAAPVPTEEETQKQQPAANSGVAALEASAEKHQHSSHASEDVAGAATARGEDVGEPPVRLAGPPPIPASPPPKPMSPAPNRPLPPPASEERSISPPPPPMGRPASTAPIGSLDEAAATLARTSTPGSAAGTGDGLARRTSMRPAIPQGLQSPPVRSREPSQFESDYEPVGEKNEVEVGDEYEDAYQQDTVQRSAVVSSPALPLSPPPRPASRAPPLPGQVVVPSRSDSSQPAVAAAQAPMSPVEPQQPPQPVHQLQSQQEPAAHASAPSQGSTLSTRQSSRDLDLMSSSRWWRHGLSPLRLPPTVAGRPDAILYADTSSGTKRGKTTHSADIYVLFGDYSTTTISLSFQEDDAEESATTLTQTHNFPPPKPSTDSLRAWSLAIGSSIAKSAADAAKHPPPTPIGDGSSRSFVQATIMSLPSALPPVGSNYGALILTQVGATVMEMGGDEPRPGDIAVCVAAELKGKKGLAPYYASYGSQADPMVSIVVECEAKKNKLRCVLQSWKSGGKGKGVEEVSLRLDDLKSGVVKVFRVPKRQEWVDW